MRTCRLDEHRPWVFLLKGALDGAAAALASEEHGTDGRSQIRVLAEGYVDPAVQKHLLRIADAREEEEIEASLDALDSIEQARR